MRRRKRVLGFILACVMVLGAVPVNFVSQAEGAASEYSETLLMRDTFEPNTSWDTSSYHWRLDNTEYAGVRTSEGKAPLGWRTAAARQLYKGETAAEGALTDVHIKSDVCVTSSAGVNPTNHQYHFIFARGTTAAEEALGFGFKTTTNATKISLIVAKFDNNPTTTYYESEAKYDLNTEYTLELFVYGNHVIAKCEDEIVFDQTVTGISASGFCGLRDRLAVNNLTTGTLSATSVYGKDYTKRGYFDNFEIYEVTNLPEKGDYADFDVVGGPIQLSVGETLGTISVLPSYAYPYGKGEATSEGVTVSKIDTKTAGIKKATVTFAGIEKTIDVYVTDASREYIADKEDFAVSPFDNGEWGTVEGVNVTGEKAVMTGVASATTGDSFSEGAISTTLSVDEWTKAEDGTCYPLTLFAKTTEGVSEGVYTRLEVTKNEDSYTAKLKSYVYLLGEASPHFSNPVTLQDFEFGKEYDLEMQFIGNYLEVSLDDEVVIQRSLNTDDASSNALIEKEGCFGFKSGAGVTASIDDLSVVKYTSFLVNKSDKIELKSYTDFTDSNEKNQRSRFLMGETVILTANPDEGEQLAAVRGLSYTIGEDETPYPLNRRWGAGQHRDASNQFVFEMPADTVTVSDSYYTQKTEDGNLGIIGISIREKTDSLKYGMRFRSRAYQTYVDTEGKTYQLTEVGTLLFKERDTITTDLLQNCYESSTGSIVDEYQTIIAKRIKANKAQDICNDYVDWSLVLTYNQETILFDVKYQAYAYAVYEGSDGNSIVKFGGTAQGLNYSYNQAATELGYGENKAPYLFYDVFSSALKSEGWTITKDTQADYQVTDGRLSVIYDASADKAAAVTARVNGGDSWTHYAVSANIGFDLSENEQSRDRYAGLMARYENRSYYEFRLLYTETIDVWGVRLLRFDYDADTNKTTNEQLVALNHSQLEKIMGSKMLSLSTEMNLRMEVRGNYIRGYVDGIRLFAYEDTSEKKLTAGTAGLKCTNNNATYEDFIVEQKAESTKVGLSLTGTKDGVYTLYQGKDIDLINEKLKILDDDGTYETAKLKQEVITSFDNTKIGTQRVDLYDSDLTLRGSVDVKISERSAELFEEFKNDTTTLWDKLKSGNAITYYLNRQNIQTLKESYDLFSPYEISTKFSADILEQYENILEGYEKVQDSNLKNYQKLLADACNDVTASTWNDSIMDNAAKWIPLNGTLYQAQTPYGLTAEGWQSPNVYGEIYSMSADMTMLSENMNMGIAVNMTETGYYMARVVTTTDSEGNITFKPELLKRTPVGLTSVKIGTDLSGLNVGDKFQIRITVLNNSVTLYIDGQNVLDYTDSSSEYLHSYGECGLRVLNGDGVYDNIRIYGTAKSRPTEEEPDVAESVYSDNFEDEVTGTSPSHWLENTTAQVVTDYWNVSELDGATVYGTSETQGYTETYLHVFEKDPSFEATIQVSDNASDGRFGFILRRSPDTAFVNLGYDFKESKWYVAAQESEAAVCKILWAKETSEFTTGRWHQVSVSAVGDTITLIVDQNEPITWTDILRTGFGKVGFYAENTAMYVDDVTYTFPNGDVPQDGVISYVLEPNVYGSYMEIESLDVNTLIATGKTKKLSTDGGVTWTDITKDSTWSGLGGSDYPTILKLHDGTYIQVLQDQNFQVQCSGDLKSWQNIGSMVPSDEIMNDSTNRKAILHVNSATEIQMTNGNYRIFCPVGFRNYNSNGSIIGHYTKIYYSDDGGVTWTASKTDTRDLLSGYTENMTWCESKVIKCDDGTLRMYYSRNNSGYMQYTESEDNGVTWSGLYSISQMPCAMTSFAISEDSQNPGTYYMVYIQGKPNYLGSMFPRLRPCLMKSTDGKNWKFLMNCEYMTSYHSVTNGVELYQILDPSLLVTDGYVYITFGRSEREYAINNANSHQAQRSYYLRVDKEKLNH